MFGLEISLEFTVCGFSSAGRDIGTGTDNYSV